MKSQIPVSEITKRHPDKLYCSTDREYANLANEIYDLVGKALPLVDDREMRNACVSLALYFEDIHSGTHQFDAFARLYGKMYGMYLPFYDSKDVSSPEAELDAMKFVLWLSFVAERAGRILNPTNTSIAEMAGTLLNHWNSKKHTISPNEELADFIFSEETQDDPYLIRSVLVWLQNRSFLGRWYSNAVMEEDHYGVKTMFTKNDKQMLRELTEDCSVFDCRSWPLSIPATKAYAEMIRIDMDDPDDEIAAEIEKMEYAKLNIYKIQNTDAEYLVVEDFRKQRYNVMLDSFDLGIRRDAKKNTHIFGSFFSFRGEWLLNGHSFLFQMSDKHYAEYCQNESQEYSMFHDYQGQYEDLIKRNDGKRLFFFKDSEDFKKWMREKIGIEHLGTLPVSALPRDGAFMAFLHPNGQMLFSFGAECIKSPDNPYYNKSKAEENAMALCFMVGGSHSDLVMYLIEHNLVPDAMLNDMNGKEHGRLLLQDNLEFMVRCIRRDIGSDKVVRRRREPGLTYDNDDNEGHKVNFETFVGILRQEETVRSKANKLWRLVSCDLTTTVIRDVDNFRDFTMPTRNLYNAYIEIDKDKIQVSTVSRYVGKINAPAASALLYNTVGKGRNWNEMFKSLDKMLRLMEKGMK